MKKFNKLKIHHIVDALNHYDEDEHYLLIEEVLDFVNAHYGNILQDLNEFALKIFTKLKNDNKQSEALIESLKNEIDSLKHDVHHLSKKSKQSDWGCWESEHKMFDALRNKYDELATFSELIKGELKDNKEKKYGK